MFKADEESKGDVDQLSRDVKTSLNESLMHLAIVHYVEKQDDRYLKSLLSVGFPLYEEDQNGDLPFFALALCGSDDEFVHVLDLLVKAGLNLNYTASEGKDLLEFLSEFNISVVKVKFMNKHGLRSVNKVSAIKNIDGNGELSETDKADIKKILN